MKDEQSSGVCITCDCVCGRAYVCEIPLLWIDKDPEAIVRLLLASGSLKSRTFAIDADNHRILHGQVTLKVQTFLDVDGFIE